MNLSTMLHVVHRSSSQEGIAPPKEHFGSIEQQLTSIPNPCSLSSYNASPGLLQNKHSLGLEAQVSLEVLGNLVHQALQGQLTDEQLR